MRFSSSNAIHETAPGFLPGPLIFLFYSFRDTRFAISVPVRPDPDGRPAVHGTEPFGAAPG